MEKKKSPKLDEKRFWPLVADKCNLDISTVKLVYVALMKTILFELLEKGFINMPQWGKFEIREYKQRNFKLNGKEWSAHDHKRVNFSPTAALKKYIRIKAGMDKYSRGNK